MSSYSTGKPGRNLGHIEDPSTVALRQMSPEQLLQLGQRDVAYLKAGIRNGELQFLIYGADGVPVAMTDAVETAIETAAEYGLEFVPVH